MAKIFYVVHEDDAEMHKEILNSRFPGYESRAINLKQLERALHEDDHLRLAVVCSEVPGDPIDMILRYKGEVPIVFIHQEDDEDFGDFICIKKPFSEKQYSKIIGNALRNSL